MDGMGLAAVIAASGTAAIGLLASLGKGIQYVITTILNAYKVQVENTEKAKDGEIAAKDERIARHMEDIAFLRTTVDNQADTIASHEGTIASHQRTIASHEDTILDLRDRLRNIERSPA